MANLPISPDSRRPLHPLLALAAGGVIITSLAVTAALTGVLPIASSRPSPSASPPVTQAVQADYRGAAQTFATPVQATAQLPQPQAATTQTQAMPPSAQPPASAAAICATCGIVESVHTIQVAGHSTGLGAIGGGLAGGLIGHQFGAGGGRTAMTLLGALGGGLAGNAAEKHLRHATAYRVTVRMANGRLRTFTYRHLPPYRAGDRVRIGHGTIIGAG